jgi:hypothetical protein
MSSTAALQTLAATAARQGVDPHDEAAIAAAFSPKVFRGRMTERVAITTAACPTCKARQGQRCSFRRTPPRPTSVHDARWKRAEAIERSSHGEAA